MALHRFIRTAAVSLVLALSLPAFTQVLTPKFDPARDAAKDVAAAASIARKQGKRVIVDVGGEWCPWCHILDHFITANADVKTLVDANYVWVKVNWSPQNKNEALLARWPEVKGYPHLFVLDGNGKLLHSQNTDELEAGKDYDKPKVLAFLRQFAKAP
jgi:thioredoxin-related protein